ncbi:MAG TPA: ferredoxin [Candidatus Caccosoma faecigallinarum]|uniref:Ferredoxin n=1 Tax=Candidatus Caccosoma faecigallinarum TaxID=2840720 RepID=A0A9D1K9A2_9FIRM|nr:ferredoxin [Candidatus Caccosoma faecigallinarum]
MAKVKVDQEACIGCGMCVSLASAVFAFDASGEKAEVISDEVDSSVEEAAASCPVSAIVIE